MCSSRRRFEAIREALPGVYWALGDESDTIHKGRVHLMHAVPMNGDAVREWIIDDPDDNLGKCCRVVHVYYIRSENVVVASSPK